MGRGENQGTQKVSATRICGFSGILLFMSSSKLKLSMSQGESKVGRAQNRCLTMSGAELCGPDKTSGGWRLGNMQVLYPEEGGSCERGSHHLGFRDGGVRIFHSLY